ncbi:MAG: hypothetical protein FD129_1813, partial [bacterium]
MRPLPGSHLSSMATLLAAIALM